jgi:hypothetical protein
MNILNIINNKYFYGFLVIIVIVHLYYFKSHLGKNQDFQTLISIYGSFGLLLTIYSLYIQMENNNLNLINNEISYFNSINDNINKTITSFFLSNKEMQYYYEELFNDESNYKQTDRNINLERMITYQILTNIDLLINYIDSFKKMNIQNFQLDIAEQKLIKTIKIFTKSKIFIEHWETFKDKYALSWTKDYIDLYI